MSFQPGKPNGVTSKMLIAHSVIVAFVIVAVVVLTIHGSVKGEAAVAVIVGVSAFGSQGIGRVLGEHLSARAGEESMAAAVQNVSSEKKP